MSSYNVKFNQAVESQNSDVLKEIRDKDINLCVWQDALSQKTIAYLEESREALEDGFRHPVKYLAQRPFYYKSWRLASDHQKRKTLREYYSKFPSGEGRESLVEDTGTLITLFQDAVEKSSRDFDMQVFVIGRNIGRWHLDNMKEQGAITLAGDTGMLWRANDTVPREWLSHWDIIKEHVDPIGQQDIIQEIGVHDFSIFNGFNTAKPLVHSTPPYSMSNGPRTILTFFT